MDREAWCAIVHGVTESDMIKHTHTDTQRERDLHKYIIQKYRIPEKHFQMGSIYHGH